MKKRAKKNFISNSKNVIWALLIVAAAVTVYGIAQAATVSHRGEDIQPPIDSTTLQGLSAADILAAGGGGGGVLTMWSKGVCEYGWNSKYYCSGVELTTPRLPGPGEGVGLCPAGWTEAYGGYGPFPALDICSGSSTLGGSASANACWTFANSVNNNNHACNTCRVCVK